MDDDSEDRDAGWKPPEQQEYTNELAKAAETKATPQEVLRLRAAEQAKAREAEEAKEARETKTDPTVQPATKGPGFSKGRRATKEKEKASAPPCSVAFFGLIIMG